jgi:rod shape-determining protein MreD
MNWAAGVRTAIICIILIVLHFTVRPLLGWRASIDFMLIAVVFGAVRMRPGVGAVYGLLLGLLSDSLTVSSFGAGGAALAIVGFGASWLKAVFFADNLVLNGFFLFLGKWVFDLVFVLLERRMGGVELLMQVLVWSSLSAAVTALAGVIVLTLLRPILEARTA